MDNLSSEFKFFHQLSLFVMSVCSVAAQNVCYRECNVFHFKESLIISSVNYKP